MVNLWYTRISTKRIDRTDLNYAPMLGDSVVYSIDIHTSSALDGQVLNIPAPTGLDINEQASASSLVYSSCLRTIFLGLFKHIRAWLTARKYIQVPSYEIALSLAKVPTEDDALNACEGGEH